MGTMLQSYDLTMADFDQLEGCNEVLNRTRPDIVRAIHDAYFEVGVDAVETNTFGTNLSALGEYGISERDLRPGRAGGPDRAGIGGRVQHGRSGPVGARQRRTRDEAADPGPRGLPPSAGRVPDPGRGDAVRRHRRGPDRDVAGSAADQGRHPRRQTGPGPRRARPAGHRARHGRDHRHHAARFGDRCRPHRAGAARDRLHRAQLRDRPGRDERTPAAPVPVRADRGQLHAQCRASATDRRRSALPAEAGRTGRRAGAVRRRVRSGAGRRLLRHRTRASAPGRRPADRPSGVAAAARAPRRCRVAVCRGAVPAGHQLPVDRRADQRQRVQGLPRRAAGGALGRLRGHRPRPDPRRRPPARSQHRLRGPRRRRRHARTGLPAGHGVDPAAGAGLHRTGGAAGRTGMSSAAAR